MKKFLSLIFVCTAIFSMETKEKPLYTNNIVSIPPQDFFCGFQGYVTIKLDVINQGVLKLYSSNSFQIVKHVDDAKSPNFQQNWSNFLYSMDGKVSLSLFVTEESGSYDLYAQDSFYIDNPEYKEAPKFLCTIQVNTKPKSIGDALIQIHHYRLEKMNEDLERYKQKYGTEWSKIKLPSTEKEYTLDSILGRGQDGTILKMIPTNDGDPIVLKVWKDHKLYNKKNCENADDTWKIKNEIDMRINLSTTKIVVPLLYDKELKISGVRALAMPFIKGTALSEIIDDKAELLSCENYQKILDQLQQYQPLLEDINDFNSGNIIVEDDMSIKLFDFAKGSRREKIRHNNNEQKRFDIIYEAIKKKQYLSLEKENLSLEKQSLR